MALVASSEIARMLESELFLRHRAPEFKLFVQTRSNYLYRYAETYKNVELTPSAAFSFLVMTGDGEHKRSVKE
jgi:hypothetical protein